EPVRAAPPESAAWRRFGLAGAVALLAVVAAFEVHFRQSVEEPTFASRLWSAEPSEGAEAARVRRLALDPQVLEILQFDEGERFELFTGRGQRFEFYDFFYEAGIMGILAAEHHTPEVCIGKYGGGTMIAKDDGREVTVGSQQVPVFGYTFRHPVGGILHAVQGIWIAGDEGSPRDRYDDLVVGVGEGRFTRFAVAWRRLLDGQREFTVQVFMILITGEMELEQAWERSETVLDSIIAAPSDRLALALP
ncbi:MAG: hypothetical protein ACLFU2_13095, partial [Opitutales bacterium]